MQHPQPRAVALLALLVRLIAVDNLWRKGLVCDGFHNPDGMADGA
jgi:hypothetical protein